MTSKLRCPHCGNTNPETIQDNGARGSALSYLCVKPCDPEDSSFDEYAAPDPEDRRICAMQWSEDE